MSIKKKELTKQLRCGSCTFIERDKIFEHKCSVLGKLPSSKACSHHLSDAYTLLSNVDDREVLGHLGLIIQHYSPMELNALASLLLRENQTRKLGYHFYQKVYVRLQGQTRANYFNNFVVGRVLDASKENVRIVGFHGKRSVSVLAINEVDSSTFYTVERFKTLREQMIEAGAYVDPETRTPQTPNKPLIKSLAHPDSLDLLDEGAARRRLKRSEKDDLVSLVRRMMRGQMKVRKTSEDKEIRII